MKKLMLAVLPLVAWSFIPACAQPPAPPASDAAPAPGVRPAASVPTDLAPPVAEVLRLAQSGVGDDVVLAYIQNSTATFHLTADDILYLRDIGLSPAVTAAMINHDSALRAQMPAPAPVPQPPPPVPATATSPPAVEAAAPTYVGSPPPEVSHFYNDLSPYGTWVSLDGVGWCWQPRIVVIQRGWRPYCDGGYWIYSDAGWCWSSTYSWGWAPFHYGRWYLHSRCGWVWVPDTVWAPAWVTWRVAGSSCGWAPLPPRSYFDVGFGWRYNGVAVGLSFDFGLASSCFTFVSVNNFVAHDIAHNCLPPAQVTTIYKQTTIINNYTVNNNIIVNRGIPVERVTAATHTEIHKASIRDWPAGSGRPAPASSERTSPVVYRHALPAPTRTAPMVARIVDARHPMVEQAPLLPVRPEQPTRQGPNPVSTSAPHPGSVPPTSTRESSGGAHRDTGNPKGGAQPQSGGAPRPPQSSAHETPGSAPAHSPPGTYQATPPYTPARRPEEAQTPSHAAPTYQSGSAASPEHVARPTQPHEEAPAHPAAPAYPHTAPARSTHGAQELHSPPPVELHQSPPPPPPSQSQKEQGSQGSASKKQPQ